MINKKSLQFSQVFCVWGIGLDDSLVSSLSFSETIVGLLRRDSFLSLLPEIHAGALELD